MNAQNKCWILSRSINGKCVEGNLRRLFFSLFNTLIDLYRSTCPKSKTRCWDGNWANSNLRIRRTRKCSNCLANANKALVVGWHVATTASSSKRREVYIDSTNGVYKWSVYDGCDLRCSPWRVQYAGSELPRKNCRARGVLVLGISTIRMHSRGSKESSRAGKIITKLTRSSMSDVHEKYAFFELGTWFFTVTKVRRIQWSSQALIQTHFSAYSRVSVGPCEGLESGVFVGACVKVGRVRHGQVYRWMNRIPVTSGNPLPQKFKRLSLGLPRPPPHKAQNNFPVHRARFCVHSE